jgi:hypothetical protein
MKSSAIKVGNRVYSIASVDDATFDLVLSQKGVQDPEIKSFIDYDDQLILVRDRLQSDHKKELLLHELLHSCMEDSGMVQDEFVENFIKVLSPRLIGIVEELPLVFSEAV